MANHKKYKINGKDIIRSTVKKGRKDADVKKESTADDEEVQAKIEELHIFLTQRGIPYFLTSRTPKSNAPIARFSFNHKHDDPEGTRVNGEYIFTVMGNAIDQLSQGHFKLVKIY